MYHLQTYFTIAISSQSDNHRPNPKEGFSNILDAQKGIPGLLGWIVQQIRVKA